MNNHQLARRVLARYSLTPADLIVDVNCTDCDLLCELAELGLRVLGINPYPAHVDTAQSHGVDVMRAPFNQGTADTIRRRYGAVRLLLLRGTTVPGSDLLAAAMRCLSSDGFVLLIGNTTTIECRPVVPILRRAA